MIGTADGKRDFFVSFNQADRAWATWIAWVLEEKGYSVFFQDWDFRGSFLEQMHQASRCTGHTLVVLSDHYLRSEYTRSEAWAALARDPVGHKDPVVTVKVGSTTEDLGLFSHFAYLDLTTSAEADAERLLFERARKAVEPAYRAKPSTRPSFPGGAKRTVPEKPSFPGVVIHLSPFFNPDFVGREQEPLRDDDADAVRLFRVPFPRNRFFTGREETLEVIQRVLGAGGTAVVSQVAAITGLGGIGKTQMALEYAWRHRNDYRVVWWMAAENEAGLDRGVADLAAELRLPGADPADPARTRAALCRWLERESGWLLILDNAEQPKTLRPYLPAVPAGHVLITSRNPLWSAVGETLPLDTWLLETSVDFLTRRAKRDDPAGAAALAAELGGLPLALEQAAAYVEATGQTFVGYLALYRKRFAELAGADEFRPQEYPDTVLTTWNVSLAAAERESPIAGDLLGLLAFLAPENIRHDLLTGHAAELPQDLAEAIADGLAFDRAVAALHHYSLIKRTEASFAVHRLMQAVTRTHLHDFLLWADAAIALVNAAFPEDSNDVRSWPVCTFLRSHAEAALAAAQNVSTDAAHTSRLLDRLAAYLDSQGLYPAAQPLFERALAIREKALGPEHPDVATSLNNLAVLYRDQGRYGEAEPLLKRALTIREEAFGPEHPDVAQSLHNLAELYRARGRFAEAEPLFQRALAIREQALGPEHPKTIETRSALSTLDVVQTKPPQDGGP